MNCGLIFYMAHKTGYCETALAGSLSAAGMAAGHIYTAFSPELLVAALNEAFQNDNVVFVVGGLGRKDEHNLADVLSKALSKNSAKPAVQKIENPCGGAQGYLLQSGKQSLIALPDDPGALTAMCSPLLLQAVQGK